MTEPEAVYREPGASWWLVALGPVIAVVALILEIVAGWTPHWVVLPIIGVVLAGFTAIQVGAARVHTRVTVSAQEVRQGTEVLPVAQIAEVLPESDEDPDSDDTDGGPRILGELSVTPRGRKPVLIRLTTGEEVVAWAKRPAKFRNALTAVLT